MSGTTSILDDLKNPEKYVAEPEAELFDEHEVRDKAGNLLKKVTKADLDQYAMESNKRASEGCPSAMTIGHTVDDEMDPDGRLIRRATEQDQPPIVGYFLGWNVKYSAVKKRYVLCATPHVMKERYLEAKQYPRASVEAWPTRKVIDPVAILKRTPERPMVWTNAAVGNRWKPEAQGEPRYRYAMEDGEPDTSKKIPEGTGAQMVGEPTPEELERFGMCMKKKYPHLEEMHEKYAAACGAAPTMAVGSQTMMDEKEKHAMAELEKKAKAQEETIKNLEKGLRHEARSKEIEQYAAILEKGEKEEILDETPEKYALHKERLVERAARMGDPTAYRMIDTSRAEAKTGTTKQFGTDPTGGDLERATKYMADHHEELQKLPNHEARWEKAKRFAMTGKDS
jgi:hypothetical protein